MKDLVAKLGHERQDVRIDAALALGRSGSDGLSALADALMGQNPRAFEAACIGIVNTFDGRSLTEQEYKALAPAVPFLNGFVEKVEILPGVNSYNEATARTVVALERIGDSSSIPPLEGLLQKVQDKISKQGTSRQYVRTEGASGYISTEDDVAAIQMAIRYIRSRE